MTVYRIHPIVMGTKVFDKSMIDENFNPPVEVKAMEMDVIPPGTHVNVYEAYDIMKKVKSAADILLSLHEPRFAAMETIP